MDENDIYKADDGILQVHHEVLARIIEVCMNFCGDP